MDCEQVSGCSDCGAGFDCAARECTAPLTLQRSPYLEMGISLMTDVLVAAVMMWILFRKKVRCRNLPSDSARH
jgi:hypothetical protein